MILKSILDFLSASFLGRAQNLSSYLPIILALYFLVLGVWIMASGFWMKKNTSLKKGAITSLILGIISLNILAIIAGAVGLSKSKNNCSKISTHF